MMFNTNSIPNVHQSLIDDGLVYCRLKLLLVVQVKERLFKVKKDHMAPKLHKQTLKKIKDLKPKVEEVLAKLANAKWGWEEGKDGGLMKKKLEYEKELKSFKENDPVALSNLEKELKLLMHADFSLLYIL